MKDQETGRYLQRKWEWTYEKGDMIMLVMS
jgi:hypothetical protein